MSKTTLHPLIAIIITILFIGAAFLGRWYTEKNKVSKIDSFVACRDAGFPILESYPAQCRTPDGRNFTEIIGEDIQSAPDTI